MANGGISIVWRIKGYAVSSDGWGVALDLNQPMESIYHDVYSEALDVVGVSNDWQYFTFAPKYSSNLWNVNDFNARNVPMMASFNFEGYAEAVQRDIEAVATASNYYYKTPVDDQSCFVDRFDCYPT